MFKKLNILLILLAVFCLITGVCAAQDQLADIKNSGELKFGVSSDYYPFVYMEGLDLDGLDIALVKEMGRRMGVTVKPIDMAFDGLIDAAMIGQVDLIGGGFSITESRKEKLDFTNAYYQAGGVILGKAGRTITEDDIRNSKIAVLKGSSFEQWVASNLVMGGKISPVNVISFSKNDDVINALKDSAVDLALIDGDVYRSRYKNDSSIVVVSDNVVNEKYGYGAVKGSTLIPELNNLLREMIKDGTAQRIADEYFSKDFSDQIQVSITRPAQVTNPAAAPAEDIVISREIPPSSGALANNPANCYNGMQFVGDVSIPDRTVLKPNMSAVKTWNIKNTGTCTWDSTYSFNYVKGSVFGPTTTKITRLVGPGETYEISVSFNTPAANGEYTAWWQMQNGNGQNFGQTIWYDFIVNDVSGSTNLKITDGAPQIYKWYPDFYTTDNGKCPKVYYEVVNAYQVEFYINNQYVDSSRNLSGYTYLCTPYKAGTYVYGIVATGATSVSDAFTFVNNTSYPSHNVGVSADYPHYTYDGNIWLINN
jgi:polar amino acid transport system substrate-binding protein